MDWPLFAALLVAPLMAERVQLARRLFAVMIVATAAYVAWRALRGG